MKIMPLKEATEETITDINRLLAQLHIEDPRQGSIVDVRDIVADTKAVLLTVKDGERIIGMATLYLIQKIGSRTGHVEDVVVDSEYRGRGLGEQLMREIIAMAREKEISSLYLTSKPGRIAANKLYQKVGFQIKETNVYRLKL